MCVFEETEQAARESTVRIMCYGVVRENSKLWYKVNYNTRKYNKQ